MPTDGRQQPPREIFAKVPSRDLDEAGPAQSEHVSVSGVFFRPGLQELDEYQDELQQSLGIEQLKLDCQPRIRLVFIQSGTQSLALNPDDGEEWTERAYSESGHELAARVLGAKHGATQLSCNCEYNDLKMTISFVPYGDDALLYNRTSNLLCVESVPNQLSVFEVEPKDFATIYPGCWRIRTAKTSLEFRLRPRRYRIVIGRETKKRSAGQASSARRIRNGVAEAPPPEEPEPSSKTVTRQAQSTGLGPSGLVRNETLNMIDEATGNIEYSIKCLDRLETKSTFEIFKAVLRDGSPKAEVVAVKMPKLGYEMYSTIANDMRHWQREVDTHRKLRHPCIASLVAFDARMLALMVEHKESYDLAHPQWCCRNGSQPDYFKGNCMDACVVAADMARALAYLTSQGVVHNDIAPKNILYRRGAGAIVIDFGESRSVDETQHMGGGRPWYVPPEWIEGTRGLPADMWSLGVVMLFLLRRLRLPERSEPEWWIAHIPAALPGSAQLAQKLEWLEKINKLRARLAKPILDQGGAQGEKVRYLVRQMLEVDPEERISAHDLVKETQAWASSVAG